MTDKPLTPASDEVPTTIKALNEKVNEIVNNGNEAIGALRRVATARDKLRTAALLLAASSLLGTVGIGYVVHQRCADYNTQNAKQVQLWEFIIGLTAGDPDPNLTPEQREARTMRFRTFLADTFPQRDCFL